MKLFAVLTSLLLSAGTAFAHADAAPHTHGQDGSIFWIPIALAFLAIAYRVTKK